MDVAKKRKMKLDEETVSQFRFDFNVTSNNFKDTFNYGVDDQQRFRSALAYGHFPLRSIGNCDEVLDD